MNDTNNLPAIPDSPLSNIIKPQVCELGKIKIGGKGAERKSARGNPFRMPVKYDHFIITTMNRLPNGDLEPDMPLMESLRETHESTDGHLRRIPITLLSNDIDDVLQTSYVWYDGKRVAARSDGITTWWWKSPKSGEWVADPVTNPWKDSFLDMHAPNKPEQKLFKQHTVFSCVIASKLGRWGGVYKFRTTSKITASQLYGSLLNIAELTGGMLAGMPLQLVVRPMQVAPEGKATTVYVVHTELVGQDIQQLRQQAIELARSEVVTRKQVESYRAEYRKLLTAPGQESDPDEIDDIQAEFSPELPDAPTEPMIVSNRLRHVVGANQPVADAEFTIELDTPADPE